MSENVAFGSKVYAYLLISDISLYISSNMLQYYFVCSVDLFIAMNFTILLPTGTVLSMLEVLVLKKKKK